MADAIAAYPTTLPGLLPSHMIEGCGRRVQQDRPAEVNRIPPGWPAPPPA